MRAEGFVLCAGVASIGAGVAVGCAAPQNGSEAGPAAQGGDGGRGGRTGARRDGGGPGGGEEDDALRIVEGDPAPGARGVYPVELYDRGAGEGMGERRRLWFRFDRPMARDRVDAVLTGGASKARRLSGAFDAGGTRFEVTVPPPDEDSPPLVDGESFELDLSSLRSEDGASLDPPTVDFHTGRRDERLEHACLHVLFGPFEAVRAAAGGATPSLTRTHRVYVTALPGGAPRVGEVSLALTGGGGAAAYDLLFDERVELSSGGGAVAVEPVPAICAGLAWRAAVTLTPGASTPLRVQSEAATVRILVEQR